MNKDKVIQKDGRAHRTNDVVELHRTYISRDYHLDVFSGREIGETGRLDIGTLKPLKPQVPPLPWFGIRWDERKNEIDVDAYDCTTEESREFKSDAPGYSGHHTVILNQPGRVAEWKLIWKGECLYHGTIRCPVGREAEFTAAIGLHPMAECEHQRRCQKCGQYFVVGNDETTCPDCRRSEP